MPFVPFPNTAEAHVRYTYQGQLIENTLYFDRVGGWDDVEMTQLGDSIASTLNSDVMPFMPNTLVLREIYVVDLSSETASAVTYTGGLPQPGLSTEPALPNNVTVTASFRTNGRGRSSRGRNYLPGLTEGRVVGNTVQTSFTDVWLPFWSEMLSLGTDEGFQWVVASRRANNEWRTTGVTAPVTAVVYTDLTVDSQRRRLPGRGS